MGKRKKNKRLLTDVELEMMNILWSVGGATVNRVIEELSLKRKLAYTSVSTMLRILEQKGLVGSRKEGRGHLYFAKLNKTQYEATTLDHLVERVFDGEPANLVRRLITAEGLSKGDLAAIKEILNQA